MTLPLIPAPAQTVAGEGSLTISDGMAVVADTAELATVAQRFIEDVRLDTGIALESASGPAPAPAIVLALDTETLDTVPQAAGLRADGKPVAEGADERHGIRIAADGIRVWGTTAEGVHRGLTSLRQLIAAAARHAPATLSAGTILDGPRFAWRGLSLDVARTFHGPQAVRRVIDMCSLHKLNVLHLHLTDDQGWRIEVPSRPNLTSIGAVGAIGDRPGGYYTLAETADLVAYAAARFVTLVPEIDMPGHTGAIFRAYPELAPATAASGAETGGLVIGTLDHEREETWRFVADVLDSVIGQFPQSAYLHIGGDEAFGMPDEAHAAFVARVIGLVRDRGRLAVGWQEIARASLGADDVVQYWIDSRDVDAMTHNDALQAMVPPEYMSLVVEALGKASGDIPRALEMGSRILISPTSRLYFDRPQAGASVDPTQEGLRHRVGLPVYPPLSLRDGVEWDPVDDTPGLDSDERVAGVEAAIWCETIADRDELEFMLLPRLGGLAEKAWSRPGATDWAEYSERLASQSGVWEARGWNYYLSDEVAWPALATAKK